MQDVRALRERHWLCARRLRDRRTQLGLTQNEVVERLDALGVNATNRTLSAIEHGQGIDIGRLPELAIALDCTVTYLLGLTGDPRRWQPDDISVPVTVDVTAPMPPGGMLDPGMPERQAAPDAGRRRHA